MQYRITNKFYNNKKFKQRRRDLRNNAPTSEIILWTRLKNSQIGYKFRRQHGIGPYIVALYCPTLKFVIEIDGASHFEEGALERDKKRQEFLERNGCFVRRYHHQKVLEDVESIVIDINYVCDELLKRSAPPPTPPR